MNNSGWICLHRKTLDNPVVMKSPNHAAVWMWLLLNAAYEERRVAFGGGFITLQPGQLVITLREISEVYGISVMTVSRILKCFRDEGLLINETSTKNSLISIVSWDKYQSRDKQAINERETDDKPAINLHIYKTNKQSKQINKLPEKVVSEGAEKQKERDDTAALYAMLVKMNEEEVG